MTSLRRRDLELVYTSEKIEIQCTKLEAAKKLFCGDAVLARSLLLE